MWHSNTTLRRCRGQGREWKMKKTVYLVRVLVWVGWLNQYQYRLCAAVRWWIMPFHSAGEGRCVQSSVFFETATCMDTVPRQSEGRHGKQLLKHTTFHLTCALWFPSVNFTPLEIPWPCNHPALLSIIHSSACHYKQSQAFSATFSDRLRILLLYWFGHFCLFSTCLYLVCVLILLILWSFLSLILPGADCNPKCHPILTIQ